MLLLICNLGVQKYTVVCIFQMRLEFLASSLFQGNGKRRRMLLLLLTSIFRRKTALAVKGVHLDYRMIAVNRELHKSNASQNLS